MAIIYSYPTVIPTSDDLVLGTDVNGTGQPTKNFTIQSIVDIVAGGAAGLGAVLAISSDALQQSATNFINIQGTGTSTFSTFNDGTMSIVGGVGTGFSSFASTSFTGKLDTNSSNQDNIRTLGILTGLQIANVTPNVNLIDTTITAPGLDTSLVTEKAVVDYVATNPTSETLTEVLANGNESGGVNSIDMTGAISNVTFIDSIDPANPTSRAQGRATFGTGNDLQIYFDGTDGHIEQTNDANLIISGKEIKIQTSQLANTEDMIKAVSDGEVILYHNGTDKIQTSSTGVTVNGVIQASVGANNGASYSFTGTANTGMYSPATNEIEFVTNGAPKLKISSDGINVTGVTESDSFTTDTTLSKTEMTRFVKSTDPSNPVTTPATTGIFATNLQVDTMIPTVLAVKNYADGAAAASTLTYKGDLNTAEPLNLATDTFLINGGSNINTSTVAVTANVGSVIVNLDNAVTITGKMQAGTLSDGTFSGTAGTYTGGVSITSTDFIGNLTGNVTGNASTANALLATGAITLSGDVGTTGDVASRTYTSGGNINLTTNIPNTIVTGKTLDGYTVGTAGTISATDTVLGAFEKLQASITATTGLSYEGLWNASTDDPALSGSTPANGVFYIVDVAGNTSLSGITDWLVGDWAIYVSNGSTTDAWQKLDMTSDITGTGANTKIAKWSGPNTLEASLISDDGTDVTIGTSGNLIVQGNTTLGDATADTTTVKGPATFDTTINITQGIFVDGTAGTNGYVLTSGNGSGAAMSWAEPTTGTVTSVGLTETGDALTITNSPITSTGNINIAGNGVPTQYINGELNLVTFPDTDNYVSWTADSDQGTDITITSGFNLKFAGAVTAGGAGIATDSAVSANIMTIGLINAGGTPGNTTFYRGDGQWSVPVGTKTETLAEVLSNDNASGANDIVMADSQKVTFGASGDLEIFHDTNNSYIETTSGSEGDLYIKSQGTGHDLYLQATDDIFIRPQGGQDGIKVKGNSAVELYHGGSKKFETTSGGVVVDGITTLGGDVNIEGNLNMDGFYIDNLEEVRFDQGSNQAIIASPGPTALEIKGANVSITGGGSIPVDGNLTVAGDLTVNGSIIHGGGGGGTAKGGTFTKMYTTVAIGASGIAFTITRATGAAMVFDVMFTGGGLGSGTSTCKKYTVVKKYGTAIGSIYYNKIIDTGPALGNSGTADYDILFDVSGSSGDAIECNITAVGVADQQIGITIDLGFGKQDAVVVMN